MTDQTASEFHLAELRSDLREVKDSMKQIAEAMTRLAVLEERHQTIMARMNRIEDRQQNSEKKVSEVREAHISLMSTIDGIVKSAKVMWLVIGVGAVALGWKAIGAAVGM